MVGYIGYKSTYIVGWLENKCKYIENDENKMIWQEMVL